MMSLNINKEVHGSAVLSATGNCVTIQGEIDQDQPNYLKDFFDKVNIQMGHTLIIDFTNLNFLNSIAIKHLIDFLASKKKMSKIIFKINKEKYWQKDCTELFTKLDEERITIEEEN